MAPITLLIILSYLLSSPAQAQTNPAQTSTSIIPANDGTSTIVNQEGNQFNITGGQQSVNGSNLFHSLTQMGLEPGEIANFISDPKTRNIITRIVGGEASIIDGLIQVTGSNANLFLMNPAGILFGANASLNVPGDFFATTATSIGFAGANAHPLATPDERWFNVFGDNDYRQLLGNPTKFAFDGTEPGAVVNLGNLAVSPEHRLTLLGGTVISTGTLQGGQILLQTVPGNSLVRLSQEGMLLSLEFNPTSRPTASLPITPITLPELLTGGNAQNANGVRVEPDGRVSLVGSNLQIQNGDLVVKQILPASEGAAPTVGLSALGSVVLQDAAETGDLTIVSASADFSAPLNASGSVSIDATSTVTAADITTVGSAVTIRAGRAIRLGNITTASGDVLLANNGSVAGRASRLPLSATSSRSDSRGEERIAPTGVVTGAIDTSSKKPNGQGGDVSISANPGDIEVAYINAAGDRANGDIQVTTPGNFRAVGGFADTMGNPISVVGTNVQINTGGAVFQVGDGDENGTTGAIVTPGVTLNPGTSITGSVVVPPSVNPDRPTSEPNISANPGPTTPSLPTATESVPSGAEANESVAPPPVAVATVNPTVPTTPKGDGEMGGRGAGEQGGFSPPSPSLPLTLNPSPKRGEGLSPPSPPLGEGASGEGFSPPSPPLGEGTGVRALAPSPSLPVSPPAAIPEIVITEVVTPEVVTPSEALTPPVVIPEVDLVTPSEALTPPVVIPEVDLVTPPALTPPVVVPEVVTPQVVVPPMVAPEVASVPTPPQVVFTTRNEPDDIRDREFLGPLVLGAGSNLEPTEIDQLRTREFLGYLGKLGSSGLQAVPQEGNIREQMASAARETGLKPAIVYAISLPEMLELVVVLPNGATVRRVVTAANHDALNALVRSFISELTDPLGSRTRSLRADVKQLAPTDAVDAPPPGYMRAARQLYDWLIAPIEDELKAARVDTLMFSLDAGMRALPLAALHNGEQFLVEKYRLSLIPSVALTNATYVPLSKALVLAMGAAEFADAAVSPLPSVPVELETIARYWQGNTFLNRAFTVGNVRARQRNEGYQILHLATHVQFFPDNFRKSYIQFYDKRLSWERLQELVWRDKPIELLVLSACETAFADPTQDISGPELGMAGLAAQTGAKSVLASLWQVDDGATSLLMREFYWQLSIQKETVKAEALRRAQLALLRDRLRFRRGAEDADFSHPYYWAAFTLVGSPW